MALRGEKRAVNERGKGNRDKRRFTRVCIESKHKIEFMFGIKILFLNRYYHYMRRMYTLK